MQKHEAFRNIEHVKSRDVMAYSVPSEGLKDT